MAKRNKAIAVKFFQDNLNEFKDFCTHISYQDKDGFLGGPTAAQASNLLNYYQNM
ncbi:hypothetical protein TVAG_501290 [Trichomonas vaginalis G3]|uniref:Uncharacterized protein n=1 Tax=Trichomonas vaginalis (strain ATCC PRA-98 / G3) TaxID=412133 RepID=A2GDE4_TRIV3|nr:hypothetical protein TVAGG3_0820270 [Trichomonas vaginalis G3]EAX84825.1 hypothetical protein TVAG_501290 [Trichomonas vaginalis G3]KAI5497834.1 hypothetical protein TVAGG3_0820270 [Trichomonas vaginalis G3]|eukprot:XP_001297755.1 hypothetical protein [Trichomonas vaginalis G3]